MKRILLLLFFSPFFLQGAWSLNQPTTTPAPATSSGSSAGWSIPTSQTPSSTTTSQTNGVWSLAVDPTGTAAQQQSSAGWVLTNAVSSITIYQTQAFQTVNSGLFSLQLAVSKFLEQYRHAGTGTSTWSLVKSAAVTQTTPTDPNQSVLQFMQLMNGASNSYIACIKQMLDGYDQLYPLYVSQVQKNNQTPDSSAQQYFQQMPFQKDSFVLSLAQSMINNMLDFIRIRMQSITIDSYGSDDSIAFFVGYSDKQIPAALATLEQAISDLQTLFDARMATITGLNSDASAQLKANYQSVIDTYAQEKGRLIVTFTIQLLQYLTKMYPMSLALQPTITDLTIDYGVITTLYSLSQKGLQGFAGVSKPPVFDTYQSLDAVLNGIRTMIAQLYVYGGIVGQNSIRKDLLAAVTAQVSATEMQNRMQLIAQLYANGASYYFNAGDKDSYNAYYVFGQNSALASMAWQAGDSFMSQGNYFQAADRYNFGYNVLKQIGSAELASYLLSLANTANLKAAQQVIKLSVNAVEYQNNIKDYVAQAFQVPTEDVFNNPPETLIQNLFYDSVSKATPPIAKIASAVLQSYKTILSTLQTTTNQVDQDKKTQLQNAITVTENIVQGAQQLLITTSQDSASVYDNIYIVNYYDPEAVFQGQQDMLSVIDSFEKADQALSAVPDNPYAPLGKLFSVTDSIKTFGKLARLNIGHLSLMSAHQAFQVAQDPAYADYQVPCVQSALLSLLCAKAVYKVFNTTAMVAYCDAQLQLLKPFAQRIVDDTVSRVSDPKITQQQYEMLVAQLMGIGFLDIAHDVNPLKNIISSYSAALEKNLFKEDFPELTLAYLYYRLYLWSLWIKDTAGAQNYKTSMGDALTKSVAVVTALMQKAGNASESYENRIAAQQAMDRYNKRIGALVIKQQYDQALFDLTGNDFCTLTPSADKQSKVIAFLSGAQVTLPNTLYALAQLYAEQATSALTTLQNDFYSANPDYSKETQDVCTSILTNYTNALAAYSQLGMQDKVMEMEQNITKAVAFSYLSSVIPSDAVTSAIKLEQIGTVTATTGGGQGDGTWKLSSGSGTTAQSGTGGGWSLSNPTTNTPTQDPSTVIALDQTLPLNFPLYLSRYSEINLSDQLDQATALAAQYQANAQEGQSIPPAVAQKKQFYTSLFQTAQQLVGKTDPDSMARLVTDIAVPLYREELTIGGFQGIFRSLDNEVALYQKQLAYMIGTGMQVRNVTLKSSLELQVRKNAQGDDQLFFVGRFMPLQSVPRFKNDFKSAIFYYSLYEKFFTPGTQPISVGNAIYFPVDSQTDRLRGSKESDRAYLASTITFQEEIASLIAPLKTLTAAQRLNTNFKDYETVYNQLAQAYEWIFATLSGIDELQKDDGVAYVDTDKRRRAIYQDYANNCRLFLFGTPLAQNYQAVVKDIVNNYLFAAQYSDASDGGAFKNSMYSKAAALNVACGDWCVAQNQPLPQVAGYPKADAHGFPAPFTPTSVPGLTCTAAPTALWPKDAPLAWRYFQAAQGYYEAAVNLYKTGYAGMHQGVVAGWNNDATIRTAFGKQITASLYAAVQRIALFARNAAVVKVATESSQGTQGYGVYLADEFAAIKANGSSGGALGAIQGAQSLVSGSGAAVDPNAVAKYQAMKKMILDAMIYASPLAGTLSSFMNDLGGVSADAQKTGPILAGRAMQCASALYLPSLSTVMQASGQGAAAQLVPLVAVSDPSLIDLNAALTPDWQMILQYADTFPSFVQYVTSALIGDETSQFALLNTASQAAAFAGFASQLTGMFRTLYGQTFLSELQGQAGADAATKIQTSINAALDAEKQELLVDATSYIG